MKTKDKLAAALREAKAPDVMIRRAEDGGYDDFLSHSATPIADLVTDATMAGLHDIAARARNGEFDATKEEAADWFEAEGRHITDPKDRHGEGGRMMP